MATFTKRGKSYLIRASSGYTVDGKQVRPSMTWRPEPGMTERQRQNKDVTLCPVYIIQVKKRQARERNRNQGKTNRPTVKSVKKKDVYFDKL